MGKKRVQTRVAHDTKTEIEAYATDRDISESDALRRLIRAGLATEGYPVTRGDGGTIEKLAQPMTVLLGAGFMLGGLGLWMAGLFASGYAVPVYLSLGLSSQFIGLALLISATVSQLVLAKPLRGLVGIKTEAPDNV